MENPVNHVSRAAAVAPIYGNVVLLGKRIEYYKGDPVPFGGYWSIFGGRIEDTESPMSCAVRELEEETQIKIKTKDLQFIKRFSDDYSEFIFYATKLPRLINPVLNYEHTEYGWFNIEALDNFPEKIDSKIAECLKHIVSPS